MKNKRLYLFGLIIIFCLVIISLLFIAFSIKKVDVTFSCAENEDETLLIQEDLSELKGKNLLFLSKNRVVEVVNNYPFFELESFKKSFPSGIEIKIKERHKAYYINFDDKNYLLSEDGIVLSDNVTDFSNLIELNTTNKEGYLNITYLSLEVGQKIRTNCDDIFNIAFEITSSIDLTDRVESMYLYYNRILGYFNIEYVTHTNAVLHISEANDNGKQKANLLFSYYDSIEKDYEKMENDKYYFYIDKNLEPGFKYKG